MRVLIAFGTRPEIIKLDITITRNVDSDPIRRSLTAALVGFAERQRLVRKPLCDELERKYAGKSEDDTK